jgi:peptidyl-prolyl cis-trans isomerase C
MGRAVLIGAAFFFIFGGIAGCGTREEKVQTAKPVVAPSVAEIEASKAAPADQAAAAAPQTQAAAQAAAPAKAQEASRAEAKAAGAKKDDAGVAVEVDGVKMTKAQLDGEVKKRIDLLKDEIKPDKLDQAKAEIRKGLVEDFVLRTLLGKEVAAKKITATEKEIAEILEGMKSQLPPGVTMDAVMKKNNIDAAKMREEIAMNIKINKLIEKGLGTKGRATDKEIGDFFEKNRDKFKQPESVHARHILVGKTAEDKEKALAEKKAKAEDLRKKLLGGADFADLAAKHSDCPSKQSGGDLGTFTRGQMVKPFEDAAFSQAKNAIGPVVETDFGFHIIQVLDRQAEQTAKLDGEMKKKIGAFLEGQKRQGFFDEMVKRLKASANIVVYGT